MRWLTLSGGPEPEGTIYMVCSPEHHPRALTYMAFTYFINLIEETTHA